MSSDVREESGQKSGIAINTRSTDVHCLNDLAFSNYFGGQLF